MRRENNVNFEEFDYDLPESLIAQTPLKDRDHSHLSSWIEKLVK